MWSRLPIVFCALFSVAAQGAFDSAAANREQAVRVQRITPAGEDVPAGRQIVIQFNRPMVPVGRMERRRDEVAVDISPAVECEWRWLNTSALACQLGENAALRPATQYRVVVERGFAADDGSVLTEQVEHRFITERPKLERAYFYTWQAPGVPVLRLQFNRPVTRDSVERTLSLAVPGGREIGVVTGEVTPGRQEGPAMFPLPGEQTFIVGKPTGAAAGAGEERRYWHAMPAEPLPGDAHVRLWTKPGLVTPEGPLHGVEHREALGFDTFPEFRFLGVRCYDNESRELRLTPPVGSGACSPLRPVFLEFSVPVIADEIKQHVRFEPDLAGGRDDYDPWENVYRYSQLSQPHQKGRTYSVHLPEALKARREYRISEAGTLRDEFGRPLDNALEIVFRTDQRPPNLTLMHRRAVIEQQVDNDVPLTVTNLDAIDVVYSGLTAAGVLAPQTARLRPPPAQDIAFHYPLGLRERLEGRSGVITGHLQPEPRVQGYNSDSYRFFAQSTPFHVHAKLGHFNTLVWVTDLATGKPVAEARVRVYVDDYARLDAVAPALGEATTDANGLALLPGRARLDPKLVYQHQWEWGAERLFVRVERGNDLALLPLDQDFDITSGSVSNWSVHGWARQRDGHVRAWGATAQGVYRAGDTIQYKLYVRSQDNRTLTSPVRGPYDLKITDPTGKPAHEAKGLWLDEFGSLAGEYAVPETGAVGWYQFELHSAYLPQALSPLQVLVADFTPAPFKVDSRLNGDLFVAGDDVTVDTLARMHAGGPYADAKARVTARIYQQSLEPDKAALRGFYFQTLVQQRSPETMFQTEGEVDQRGEMRSSFTARSDYVLYGRLDVESAVSDDRGKYIAGFASARYAGRDRYVGLRRHGWLLHEDKPAKVDVAVVDAAGHPVADVAVTVKVEREEITAARVKGAGNAFITRYNRAWIEADGCSVRTTSEPVVCEFTPESPGRYRIVGSVADTKGRSHRTELQQWVVGKGRVLWAEQPSNTLEIIPEQTSYRVGDTARYLIKNPFPGAQALITVERYGIIEQRVQTLAESTPVIEVPVTADAIPGFYLSVVVMSPRVEAPPSEEGVDLGRPTMRMGYVETQVKDPYKEMAIDAKPARDEYRPGDTVRIELEARPRHGAADRPVQLAVAVLDEAVFDLIQGGESYFDPYNGFYKLEPLDVENYSLLTRLIGLQKFEKKGADAGGDGGDADARRIDRYVSYWNPDVRVDRAGRAQIEFEAPGNLTGWRVLVLGATPEDRFGLAQTRFRVNQPTEIRPAMPNQVLQGDRFQAGFSIMNRTDRERTLKVQWRVEGLSGTPQLSEQSLELGPYKRQTVYLPVATERPGRLKFVLTAGDATDRDKLIHELPVGERKSPVTAATYGTTVENAIEEVVRYPTDILPTVGGLSVVLSPTVIGNVDGAFEYLRQYPYACWEQKLTKGVMASHFTNLRDYVRPGFVWQEAATLPAATLNQAASFQAPNGGMAYFRAANAYVSPYLSAYTALAFNWLRSSGHLPPDQVEKRLHDYLRTLLRRDVVPDFYSPGMASTVRAVALAALAERGNVTQSDLERYRRHVPGMSLFGKAHYLQAALDVPGTETLRSEVADDILSHAVQSGGKFGFNEALDDGYVRILSTPLRTQCAILSALTQMGETEQGAAQVGDVPFKLVRAITQTRGNRDHWENTQENMFCMNALIDYARVYEQDAPTMQVAVRADREKLGEAKFASVRDDAVTLRRPMRAGDAGRERRVHLEKEGDGRLYYSVRLAYAPAAEQQDPINAGIELRREYSVQRGGKWRLLQSPMRLRRGELVRVDLYLSLPTARHFVVVDDPVPGGLEPVNRQLATASTVDADAGAYQASDGSWYLKYRDWISYNVTRWSFYHQELRHDAARFYSDYLPPGNYHLSYTAQAIADGTFHVGAVHAEEMYDPDVFGKGSSATLEVGE